MKNTKPKFYGNHLHWDIERSAKPFRVFVVEPDIYDPKHHVSIFDAALSVLTITPVEVIDPYKTTREAAPPEPFDLVTFPEAFLPANHLVSILNIIGHVPSLGCVHVGLRPTASKDQHLFSVDQLQKLLEAVATVSGIVPADLVPFRTWLEVQHINHLFNVGCLFTVDANQGIRVCLHPKLVRSQFEKSALPEKHMEEANLLTLVTLHPTNKTYKTVTLQPLLCSDALELPTDRGLGGPLDAVNRDAECVSKFPPDHIDIVSVASCTPQPEILSTKGHSYFAWHSEFKSTFVRAAMRDALSRHNYSTFILSNFRNLTSDIPGGLSGAFIPVRLRPLEYGDFVTITCWGRPEPKKNNTWSPEDEGYKTAISWQSRGYLAYLERLEERADPTGRMFGFTVDPLPRDRSPWGEEAAITKCSRMIGKTPDHGATVIFTGV